MYNYFKLYAWIIHSFGFDEFTVTEFKNTFESAQHAKVLHDLTKLGFLKRIKRGAYTVIKPHDILDQIVTRNHADIDLIHKVGNKKYAFSHDNAVRIWTGGKSHGRISKGYLPIHINVLEKDLGWWEKFFQVHDAEYCVEGKNRTLFGVVYLLHPKTSFKFVVKYKMPTISKQEVVQYCKANREQYSDALKHLK